MPMERTNLPYLVFLSFWFLCMTSSTGGNDTSAAREFEMGCIKREREALLEFKHHLLDRYNQLSSWETKEKDCCKWTGIFCSEKTGHVYGLDLRPQIYYYPFGMPYTFKQFEGEIGSSLLELQYLTYLDLSWFQGNKTSLPKFIGSLKNLKYLNLSNGGFGAETLDHLGNLSRLVTLDLSSNYFQNLHSLMFLSHLSALKHLDMSRNYFTQANYWFQAINLMPSLVNLHLAYCFLSLMIPPPLSYANSSKFLEVIDFSNNRLTSSIFLWVVNFNYSLVALHFDQNQLQGQIPDEFGAMFSLKYLNLASNRLEGDTPSSLGNLLSLETLDLSWNYLTGEVPNLQNLSSMTELRLQMNKLNGTSLTQSVGQLSDLEVLDLSSNSMSAIISDIHFLRLSKLWLLDVSNNSFTLKVSSDWFPPFQLQILKMRSCNMGPHFPQWIRTQKRIVYLDISDTEISDVISDWFWKLPPTLKYLNLSFNSISGEVSTLALMVDNLYSAIDVSNNHFDGAVPQLHPNTTLLDLSKNRFSGNISNLCSSSGENLGYLDLSNNFLSGELSDCWIKLKGLNIINFGNNNISGSIPASFGQIPWLMSLQLNRNSLSGELPSSLCNCTHLQLLDVGENRLSGRIPEWIGQNLSDLIVLRLRSNRFHGTIPKQLCLLDSLQILDLSHNYISGRIPWCLNNFSAMANKTQQTFTGYFYNSLRDARKPYDSFYSGQFVNVVMVAWKGLELEYGKTLGLVKCIDLSCNNITGKIPDEITTLVGLISLNLSHNNLSGFIPARINHMDSLESLDFSSNHLSGKLPEGLSDLNFLSWLNLSDNNFWGKIPTSTQLQSFPNTSFQENAGLCGKPLPKICPGEEAEPPLKDGGRKNVDEQGKDEIISSGFYLSMGAGFATGFWAVCGCLLLYRPWRHAYFRFLDTIGDWFYLRLVLTVAKIGRIPSRFKV